MHIEKTSCEILPAEDARWRLRNASPQVRFAVDRNRSALGIPPLWPSNANPQARKLPATTRRKPTIRRTLPPIGLVVVRGAGIISHRSDADVEYLAEGAFDESLKRIAAKHDDFVLRTHHGGNVLTSAAEGNLVLERVGHTPVAVWFPDADDPLQVAFATRSKTGDLRCSAEFRTLRHTIADGVRRLDEIRLCGVSLLEPGQEPAYSACLVAPLDAAAIKRSLFQLVGKAIRRAEGK